MSSTTSTAPERVESPFSTISQEIISLRGKVESARKKAEETYGDLNISYAEETRQMMIKLTCERVIANIQDIKAQIDAVSKLTAQ